MNLKLNMKDINKILAKAHFKNIFFLNDVKKQHFCTNMFLWRCTTFERIGPTFERKKSYVWAQKNPRLSAFYRSYLPEKKNFYRHF